MQQGVLYIHRIKRDLGGNTNDTKRNDFFRKQADSAS